MQTVLVTDEPNYWEFLSHLTQITHVLDYLCAPNYLEHRTIRVINLCSSYHYQTIGYYVSLLAQARDHKMIPSVVNIQDVLNPSLSKQISHNIDEELQHSLQDIKTNDFTLSLYFGQNMAKRHANLAKKLHGLFPLPLIRFTLEKRKHWSIKKIMPLSPKDVPANHNEFLQQAAIEYFSKKRFHQCRSKKPRFHDLAILIDPTAPTGGPSNKKALELFVNAGEEIGLNVDFIDKNCSKAIAEYDALFIRATTAVNHYTYRFARLAAQENLIVIDDPQSIVKCTNKVYLAELLMSHQILTPHTQFVSRYDNKLPEVTFPCVLKKPDSAFSHGVIKLENQKELEKSVTQFLKTSDLVLIQPFIPTDFDWRIGILDNKPLFACRYYMAKDHWQIFDWNSSCPEGDADTLPIDKVPEGIIKTAIKASRLIGNGLYGVDIKCYEDEYYVVEINDNPSIDAGVEDGLLGGLIYHQIMSTFLHRIRRKHGYE